MTYYAVLHVVFLSEPLFCLHLNFLNDIEAPKALDVQLGGLHIEPSEANFVLAAILNGGKKDYHQC